MQNSGLFTGCPSFQSANQQCRSTQWYLRIKFSTWRAPETSP